MPERPAWEAFARAAVRGVRGSADPGSGRDAGGVGLAPGLARGAAARGSVHGAAPGVGMGGRRRVQSGPPLRHGVRRLARTLGTAVVHWARERSRELSNDEPRRAVDLRLVPAVALAWVGAVLGRVSQCGAPDDDGVQDGR
ncbi:hypothetical protein ACQCSX_05095 [Pseudarthrobacter sp. P1]|uniref:hypothetical protein n=1 Tax=Pseudarthrobacter sp. P1 TaxID=3418418 RepID=UPI003CF42637